MSAPEIIGVLILGAIGFFTLVYFMWLVGSIAKYFDAKTVKEKAITAKLNKESPILDRMQFSVGLMKMIDALIEIEIENFFELRTTLDAAYNVMNIDKDIEDISRKVYNKIKPETYIHEDSILQPEAYFLYISQRCTTLMFGTAKRSNIKIYVEQRKDE